ncbi:MAG: CHASE domain-containing sensor histidine kinase [Pyrinomonadaceae bacterium]
MVTGVEKNDNLKQKVDNLKLPYLVLAVSIILTLGITYIFYQSAKNKDQIRFNTNVNRIQNTIEERISLYVVLLKSGRGFIKANETLKRQDFANFVGSLELEKNYKGVQGIGYSVVFKPEEREDLINTMQSEGFADFRVFPASTRESYQSVIFLEPLNDSNRKAIGFDMSTEEKRRIALEKARDTGEAAATSQVILLTETGQEVQKGFLIYLPVYKNEVFPETVEARRENLRGFIYSPFRAEKFLSEIHDITNINELRVKIYDGEISPENLLTSSNIEQASSPTPAINETISTRNQINVAGQNWTVEYETLPDFNGQSSLGWTPLIFTGSIAFSLILFGLTYWEAASRAKVQKIAGELFESENQKRKLLVKEKEARQSAEFANRAKDEFISVISHELRTPLNAIAGWARILKASHITQEKRHTALEKIEKNLRHQTELIDDMINYSQMIADNSGIKKQNFVVSEVFNEVFEEIKPAAEEKKIQFEINNTLNGCVVTGDKQKMKILFGNILSNAVKFTPEGGNVNAELKKNNGEINLSVQDTGIGIKNEFLPHIFEQFRQADSTITRKHGGMGLGLAISKHIVKLHNGTIEAKSKGEGTGTTIVVKIPLKNA